MCHSFQTLFFFSKTLPLIRCLSQTGLLASVPTNHNGNGNGGMMAYSPGEQQSGTSTTASMYRTHCTSHCTSHTRTVHRTTYRTHALHIEHTHCTSQTCTAHCTAHQTRTEHRTLYPSLFNCCTSLSLFNCSTSLSRLNCSALLSV